MKQWSIGSRYVTAEIQSLGAMLGPAYYRLGGSTVQPLMVADWGDRTSAEHGALPGMLRRLRGEWVCVPFGAPDVRDDLPSCWRPIADGRSDDHDSYVHGRTSNWEWQLSEIRSDRIEVTLDYPDDDPITRVTRAIVASADSPCLDFRLRIEARQECELPIGIHPIFRLPLTPRTADLIFSDQARVWTSPVPEDTAIARFESDARQRLLDCVPLRGGGEVEDVRRLPLPYAAEEVLLVTGCHGHAILENKEENYRVTVMWDSNHFPACQLWLSNRGRASFPWDGRFVAVAIEPVCSAFDYGIAVSQNRANPLWQAGIACTHRVSPTQPFETTYRIKVCSLT